MIYTVTLNPSLDYVLQVDNLVKNCVNRSSSEQLIAGGKGLNVSIMLKNLGIQTVTLGFIAGFTGEKIREEVKKIGCIDEFIMLPKGLSRINIKLKGSEETEINAQGPYIPEQSLNILFKKLAKLKDNDILILAGNAPSSLGNDIYAKIMSTLSDRNILTVVDASGEQLIKTLKYKPFLIKPNIHELSEVFNVPIETKEDIILYAKKLCELGAKNVIVSMDKRGAVMVCSESEYYCKAKCISAVNSTGAGDSMVAGFLAKYLESRDKKKALSFAVATGTAATSCMGFPTKEDIIALFE